MYADIPAIDGVRPSSGIVLTKHILHNCFTAFKNTEHGKTLQVLAIQQWLKYTYQYSNFPTCEDAVAVVLYQFLNVK